MTRLGTATRRASSAGALGPLLRQWRAHRGYSQLRLALEADVSQRHLSFVESGRSHPSRDMIGRIAGALDLPLRARNDLLVASGFAPTYGERSLDQPDMAAVRDILGRILSHHEPYPAMVLDREWNFVLRNDAHRRVIAACLDGADPAGVAPGHANNFLHLMFAERGIRRRVRNWDQVSTGLLIRLGREARNYPGSPSEVLLRELTHDAPPPPLAVGDEPLMPTIPVELVVDAGVVLRLTNTLTTFGTPQDVSVQELRIEAAYPMDAATDEYLQSAKTAPSTGGPEVEPRVEVRRRRRHHVQDRRRQQPDLT